MVLHGYDIWKGILLYYIISNYIISYLVSCYVVLCIVMLYTILYSIILYYIILYYIILYYIILYYIILHYIILYYIILLLRQTQIYRVEHEKIAAKWLLAAAAATTSVVTWSRYSHKQLGNAQSSSWWKTGVVPVLWAMRGNQEILPPHTLTDTDTETGLLFRAPLCILEVRSSATWTRFGLRSSNQQAVWKNKKTKLTTVLINWDPCLVTQTISYIKIKLNIFWTTGINLMN